MVAIISPPGLPDRAADPKYLDTNTPTTDRQPHTWLSVLKRTCYCPSPPRRARELLFDGDGHGKKLRLSPWQADELQADWQLVTLLLRLRLLLVLVDWEGKTDGT